jgi:diguanylate cyclase (GGDEF)-like protein
MEFSYDRSPKNPAREKARDSDTSASASPAAPAKELPSGVSEAPPQAPIPDFGSPQTVVDRSRDTMTDALTGAASLHYLMKELPREYARCHRYRHSLAIVRCDIDRLKLVNVGFGRDAGDEVLRAFNARALRVIRSSDWIARVVDDEFVVVLPETDLDGAAIVAERIRQGMAGRPVIAGKDSFPATVSIGYCAVLNPSELARLACDDMLQVSAEQLRIAVRDGRNRISGAYARRAPDPEPTAVTNITVAAPDELMVVEYDETPPGSRTTR